MLKSQDGDSAKTGYGMILSYRPMLLKESIGILKRNR
jgi:hypothetical protein